MEIIMKFKSALSSFYNASFGYIKGPCRRDHTQPELDSDLEPELIGAEPEIGVKQKMSPAF